MFYFSNDNMSFKDCLPHHMLWFFYPAMILFLHRRCVCLFVCFSTPHVFSNYLCICIYLKLFSHKSIYHERISSWPTTNDRTDGQVTKFKQQQHKYKYKYLQTNKSSDDTNPRTRDTMTETNGFECV